MATTSASPVFPDNPDAPLGPLALSLSGGGYRAAGFHLGVLGLLERVGLLKDVASLSTVSGGTIFGAAWIVSRLDGADFSAFRERFRGWTMRTNVVREALARVAAGGQKASLIRSAASVYADPAFLGTRHFGEVMRGVGLPENVIFNATEFHSGIAFRFRRTPNSAARIGNGNFVVPREVAEHVRLADVVAASSCFPGGFEPICFPDEFEWGAEYGLERARAALGDRFRPALPLMDGGVYDNQGVGSSVLANTHGDAATLLISDTNTRQGALYTSPAPASPGRLTLNGTAWLGRILFVLAVASVVALGIHGWRESRQDGGLEWQDVLVYLVPGLFCLAGAAALSVTEMRDPLPPEVLAAYRAGNAEDEHLLGGHGGSHAYLVNEFVQAIAANRRPAIHAWEAARYFVPGIIAHQSALRDGELLKIPDFGNPPD